MTVSAGKPVGATKFYGGGEAVTWAGQAVERVKYLAGGTLASYWSKYATRDVDCYDQYLERKAIEVRAVRTFIYDKQSVPLDKVYIPARIVEGGITVDALLKELCSPERLNRDREANAFVVLGSAGMGKSLLMKNAFFKLQSVEPARIPVFIEVRRWNRVKIDDFVARIVDEIFATGVECSHEMVVAALESGLFVILLDGMDELKGAIEDHYDEQLNDFVVRFPRTPILLSSRPAPRIRSWPPMESRHIAPLDLRRAQKMIEKIDFDPPIKDRFLERLPALFRTHLEFASIPMLCTIMLLTFADSGQISDERHEFYEDAFSALWSRHDSRKVGFQRDRRTGLVKQKFIRLLSAFGFSSYFKSDYDMRERHFRRHHLDAVSLSDAPCDVEDFLYDFTVSTSVGVEDGAIIRFCHRSFQEYFAALFISETGDDKAGALIEAVSGRIFTDNVLPLLLSMDAEKIETHWVMKHLEFLIDIIGIERISTKAYSRLMKPKKGTTAAQSIMAQLRILYDFKPKTETLEAATDAIRDVAEDGVPFLKEEGPDDLFEQDRDNFLSLFDRLTKTYGTRYSALNNLLKAPDESDR